jgi:coenzyme F420 hydrogenase subunit beta
MSFPLPPALARVVAGQLCSGCGLCAGTTPGISMARDGKGWWRPVADAPVDAAGNDRLAAVCPGSTVAPWQGAAIDPLWGPYRRVATGHATDAAVRHGASSGGVLSALAIHALQSGLVDRVLHVGMAADAPLLTAIARSVDRAGVLRAAGSRYAPAAPLAELADDLARPGRILFIGKPCDVGALRQLLRHDPAMAARFPLLLSFFCAGTPSQDGTDRLLARMGAAGQPISAFRYRGDGWPGFATASHPDGSSHRLSYAQSWGDVLSKEVQFRCKICPDAVGGVADVAAADAWYGGESGYPAFDEADGRSLVITRSAAGDALLDAAVAAGAIAVQPLAMAEVIRMQPHQARRKQLVASRLAALAATGQPRPRTTGLAVLAAAVQGGIAASVKSFAGTARRIVQNRR